MKLLKLVRLIVVLVPMVSGKHMTRDRRQTPLKNKQLMTTNPQQEQELCARFSKEPYFLVEMLLGKPWRVYYSWNIDLQNKCVDMTFMNGTPMIVKSFYKNMNEYLDTWPDWNAATVLVNMSRLRYEILLFADPGAPGMFQGVPYVDTGNLPSSKEMVPLHKFNLKLINGGRYLLMTDCQAGVTTLSTRKNNFPVRADISAIVRNLDIGAGHHTCQSIKKKNKNVPQE